MGFEISLRSSERRSLIYWRMSGLFLVICTHRTDPRCFIGVCPAPPLPPAAPPISCHLQPRCACALCPLLLRASFHHPHLPEGLSLFSCIYPFSSFAPLRRSSCCENKKSGVCATFLRLRTLFCPFKSKTGCRSADLLRFCA